MSVVWLILTVGFIAAEACTVTVVSIWFAVGALGALLVSLLNGSIWLQVLVFFLLSAGALLALRPVVKKYFTPKLTRTNVDAVIGATGLVTARIDNRVGAGQVKLGAMEWSARSTNGEPIEEGTQIRVDRIEGVKVFVTPVNVPVI